MKFHLLVLLVVEVVIGSGLLLPPASVLLPPAHPQPVDVVQRMLAARLAHLLPRPATAHHRHPAQQHPPLPRTQILIDYIFVKVQNKDNRQNGKGKMFRLCSIFLCMLYKDFKHYFKVYRRLGVANSEWLLRN